jgi:predicted RNase H-like nuclease (RuvC/YqgF family)
MSSKEQKELKEVKTRPLLQKIENLKIDLQEADEDISNLYNNLQKAVELLDLSTDFTKGKLKYDTVTLVKLLRKIYEFPNKELV